MHPLTHPNDALGLGHFYYCHVPVRSRILEAGQQDGLYSIETDGYEFFYIVQCFINRNNVISNILMYIFGLNGQH